MNIFDRRVMHAARPSSDRIERRLEKCAEDGRADSEPIKVGGAREQPMLTGARKLGDGIGACKEIAVDIRKLFQLRAEIWIALLDGLIEDGEQID